jgi:YfiH family protein
MKAHRDFEVGGKLIPKARVVIAEQTHSDLIRLCGEAEAGAGFDGKPQIATADGLVTATPGLYLMIRTADCTPVLFSDLHNRAVAAVHSGREGSRRNIAGKAVRLLRERFGIMPGEITAQIGAGICPAHYEVSEELWDGFLLSLRQQGLCPDASRHRHLNIRLAIFQQLIAEGIPFRNIEQDLACTYETPGLHSYRRDGTRNRQINLIGIEYE